ncbi:AP endonuclease [Coprinopsis marcescibilis]|uniref:Apurinic-apyrimidinic endonuclease 1 n=1 Tax=Coprinopsis marcescibilis TaxID=230819 RepID=A0A5C3KCX6_COPMA|nr:AP endonuclease [Coprinopsis marcescibilis]
MPATRRTRSSSAAQGAVNEGGVDELNARPRKRTRLQAEATQLSIPENEEYTDTQELLQESQLQQIPSTTTKKASTRKGKGRVKPSKDAGDEDLIDDSEFLPRVLSAWKAGAHVSAAGGVENAVINAAAIGANAFALFLKSQRKWTSPNLTERSVNLFKQRMKRFNYESRHVLPHGSYLINLGNPDIEKRMKSYECFLDDLKRCEQLGLTLYNFHPGSTVGQATPSESMALIAECINNAHEETSTVTIVLENMAGAGNIIGSTFEQLAEIIEHVKDKTRVGVCMDTCHAFSAGYDIRTKKGWNSTLINFDSIVGLSYLKGMHLNDSKTEFNSKRDRHENLGMGTLKLEAFSHILSDPRVHDVPLILETPSFEKPREVWGTEIQVLNSLSPPQPSEGPSDQQLDSKTGTDNGRSMEELAERVRNAVKGVSAGGKGKASKKTGAVKGTKRKRAKKGEDEDDNGDSECSHD